MFIAVGAPHTDRRQKREEKPSLLKPEPAFPSHDQLKLSRKREDPHH